MSKSVLVIDTPESCKECQLKRDKYKESKLCAATKTYIDSYYDDDSRPDWCPLSPLPSYRPINEDIRRGDTKSTTHLITSIHDIGYNECLDEILNGEK